MIAATQMNARIAPACSRRAAPCRAHNKAVPVRGKAKIPTKTSAMVSGGRAPRGCVSTRAAGDDDGAEASTSEKQEEKFDLELAFNDHAKCRALHPARRQAWLNLFPEQWRQVETDEVVERTARLLRTDEVTG